MTPEELEAMKKAANLVTQAQPKGGWGYAPVPPQGGGGQDLAAPPVFDQAAEALTTPSPYVLRKPAEGGGMAAAGQAGVRATELENMKSLLSPEQLAEYQKAQGDAPPVKGTPPIEADPISPAYSREFQEAILEDQKKPKASYGGGSRVRSSHYYPEDFAERMQMAYASGRINKGEFERQMKGFRQWEQSTKGTYAGMQREKADAQVLHDAAQVQYEADIASAEAKAAEAQLSALDQMQSSREYWTSLTDMYQKKMDDTVQQLQAERDRLKANAPNVLGNFAEGLADAIALGFGQYASMIGGGPNVALQIINQRTQKKIAQAKLDAQHGAQIQDSLAREFSMLQSQFKSEEVAEKMLYSMMLDETASRVSAIGKLGGSEALARRSENMLASIAQSKKAAEAEVLHALTVQNQKELQAAAASRQKAMDKARTQAMARAALAAAGGRPITEERPAGEPITIQASNGASLKGFAPAGVVSNYNKSRDSLRMAKQAAENLLRIEKETDLMGANPTTLWSGSKGHDWDQNATILLKGMKDAGSAVGAWDKGAQELLSPFDYGGRFDILTTDWGKKFYTEEKIQATLDLIRQVEQQTVDSVMEHVEPWSEVQVPYWDEDAEMMGWKNMYIRGRESDYSQRQKTNAADLAAQTGGFAGTLK